MRCLIGAAFEPAGEGDDFENGQTIKEHESGPTTRFFGDYELIEEIARGGMGIVYKARQLGLDRLVAVKFLMTGSSASRDFIFRFQNEAAAASRLDHPNIVPVHEFGQHEGQYFLVMKFIAGGSLAEKIAQWKSTVQDGKRERTIASLMVKIARAVHYAHQRGVLHRDLKPGNILLDAEGEPFVTDFGLAKITESGSDITLTQAVIGTASYMAPEQAAGGAKELTTAADIYSLGAILYELLTGHPPFQGKNAVEILRHVVDREPERPSAVNCLVNADLETISLKCLQKEPGRRYQTAQDVADDLNRFIRHEPILARPTRAVAKAWRWCRRKPALATSFLSILTLLLIVIIGSPFALYRISKAREAEHRENYFASIGLADSYIKQGSIDRALALLTNCPAKYRHWEWGRLMYLCNQEIRVMRLPVKRLEYDWLPFIVLNADNSRMAIISDDRVAKLWETITGRELLSFGTKSNQLSALFVFSPNGKELAIALRDRTVTLWNAESGSELFRVAPMSNGIVSLVYSRDGKRLGLITSDQKATVLDAKTGTILFTTPAIPGYFQKLEFDLDGLQWATISAEGEISLWDAMAGSRRHVLKARSNTLLGLFFSPDGKKLCTELGIDESKLWNCETGKEICSLPFRTVRGAFSPNGALLAATDGDNLTFLWDAETGRRVGLLGGHSAHISYLGFSDGGRTITTASMDGEVRVWPGDIGQNVLRSEDLFDAASFSPDGRRIVTAHMDSVAKLWEAQTGQELLTFRGHLQWVRDASFSRDGRRIVTAAGDKTAKVWDSESGKELLTLRGHTASLESAEFSPDDRLIATTSWDGAAKLWDAVSGREVFHLEGHAGPVYKGQFSPDGKRLATSSLDQTVIIWDTVTGQNLQVLRGHSSFVWSVAFSPNGRWLVSSAADGTAIIWDTESYVKVHVLKSRFDCSYLQFSPDSRRLAMSRSQKFSEVGRSTIEIFDTETWRQILALEGHSGLIFDVQFSNDGRRLVSAGTDHTARIWESFPWQEEDYPGSADMSLAVRARIFGNEYWRKRLAAAKEPPRLLSGMPLTLDRSLWLPRDAEATPKMVDLTDHYNGVLSVCWGPVGNTKDFGWDLTAMPTGTVKLAEVPFDVRGVIHLRRSARDNNEARFFRRVPTEVNGIKVGQKLDRLHLLHGLQRSEVDGTVIATLILHFADGSSSEVEIVYGRHVRDWYSLADFDQSTDEAIVAWSGSNASTKMLGGRVQVYKASFKNPFPDLEVTSIDFVSKVTRSGPFLIAMTVE